MRMEPSLKEKEKILKTDLVSINGLPAVTDRFCCFFTHLMNEYSS